MGRRQYEVGVAGHMGLMYPTGVRKASNEHSPAAGCRSPGPSNHVDRIAGGA
jgi:hypothetical protein